MLKAALAHFDAAEKHNIVILFSHELSAQCPKESPNPDTHDQRNRAKSLARRVLEQHLFKIIPKLA